MDPVPVQGAPVVGQKWDTGKPTYWRAMRRFPLSIAGAARAADYGYKKYCEGRGIPDDNWKSVPDFEKRYFDALIRHWEALQRGKTHDAESGLSHWDHFSWNANALAQMGHEALVEAVKATKERRDFLAQDTTTAAIKAVNEAVRARDKASSYAHQIDNVPDYPGYDR